jgi:hypothetical protein
VKFKFFFAWYDFWVGFYYDQLQRALYICPIPCCVFKLSWGHEIVFPPEMVECEITNEAAKDYVITTQLKKKIKK